MSALHVAHLRRPRRAWTVFVMLLLAAGAVGQRADAPAVDWTTRLEELYPESPLAYFELAEEVADAAASDEDRSLARRLFALAGVLDPDRYGRSACLALADLVESDAERARLKALAGLLGERGIAPAGGLGARVGLTRLMSQEAVLGVTEAFSHYRRGKGARVTTALNKPGAMELLQECDRFLPGGVNRFLEDSRLYRGQLRPSLASDDLTLMLRLEVALLAGTQRPWSSELLFGGGAPLIEVDPARLSDTLEVDASRPYYRSGRWVPADQAD